MWRGWHSGNNGEVIGKRLDAVKVHAGTFTHVGMELVQSENGDVELTQGSFTEAMQPIDTSPMLWKERVRLLPGEGSKLCQGKIGELCWLEAVSRPDIGARFARFASGIHVLKR